MILEREIALTRYKVNFNDWWWAWLEKKYIDTYTYAPRYEYTYIRIYANICLINILNLSCNELLSS